MLKPPPPLDGLAPVISMIRLGSESTTFKLIRRLWCCLGLQLRVTEVALSAWWGGGLAWSVTTTLSGWWGGGLDWSVTTTLSEWWGGGPDWSVTTTLSAWWEVDRTGLWPQHCQNCKRWTGLVYNHDIVRMVRRWTGLVCNHDIISMVRGRPDWSLTTTLSAWKEVDRTGLWPWHYQHGEAVDRTGLWHQHFQHGQKYVFYKWKVNIVLAKSSRTHTHIQIKWFKSYAVYGTFCPVKYLILTET